MRLRKLVLSLVSSLVVSSGYAIAEEQKVSSWGDTITMRDSIPLSVALKKNSESKNQEFLVSAQVGKVCKKKACWMELVDGAEKIRVTFKDYGFFVNPKMGGAKVLAQGRFEEKNYSVKDLKHFLKDEGASKDEIAAVKEPKTVLEFVASGVSLQ
jgi:hypothetical protein